MLSGSISNISTEWQSYLLLFSVGLSLTEAKVKITVARCFVSIGKKMDMEPVRLPQKKFYRQRAHSNPMTDHSFDVYVCFFLV